MIQEERIHLLLFLISLSFLVMLQRYYAMSACKLLPDDAGLR